MKQDDGLKKKTTKTGPSDVLKKALGNINDTGDGPDKTKAPPIADIDVTVGDTSTSPPLEPPKVVVGEEKVNPIKRTRRKRTTKKAQQIFNGGTLMFLVDVAIPRAVAFANNTIVSKEADKIDFNDMKLTEEERKELKAVSEEAAKMIGLASDPLTTFALMIGIIYAMKFLSLK